jgi:hypothetical protein
MLERLESRAAAVADARATDKIMVLAGQLRELLPSDINVEAGEEGVLLAGPGLGHRFVLDSSLRWTIAGLLK